MPLLDDHRWGEIAPPGRYWPVLHFSSVIVFGAGGQDGGGEGQDAEKA